MTEVNKRIVEINKKSIGLYLKIERENLVNVVETPDGVSFQFKNGCTFNFEDSYMPNAVKARMQLADSQFNEHDLIYDLDDYKTPVLVIAK